MYRSFLFNDTSSAESYPYLHTLSRHDARQILLSDFSANPFTTVGQPNTLLGNIFFIFNSGLFVGGTALLTYFLLATVAQTAHEGEVLGTRINGLWVDRKSVV